ncbi:MAG: zinc ribbon domain-containing protein [Candidatus Methanofastidiosum sp.]|nr:zinc ribbon domain-containing protein [Methanofastidiosum sp.]NYT03169.1 zinc ribbon domain-containing protein [Candidatus Methanofastidiosa archaeon]NYT13947.1 zinc ribbon domain-containing protein [Candidatus Methanofastidiosa archaeon]
MDKSRIISLLGGIILIVAAFLPFFYFIDGWYSIFEITYAVLMNFTNNATMQNFLLQINPSYGMAAMTLALMVAGFFLLVIGGLLAIIKKSGGSVAGPGGMVVLTIAGFLYAGALIFGFLAIGFYLGWVGAILCIIGGAISPDKDKSRVNVSVNQQQNVTTTGTPITSNQNTNNPPQNKDIKFCNQCGYQNKKDTSFCVNCGNRL